MSDDIMCRVCGGPWDHLFQYKLLGAPGDIYGACVCSACVRLKDGESPGQRLKRVTLGIRERDARKAIVLPPGLEMTITALPKGAAWDRFGELVRQANESVAKGLLGARWVRDGDGSMTIAEAQGAATEPEWRQWEQAHSTPSDDEIDPDEV